MPRSKGRDLAGVPNGTVVFTHEVHSGAHRIALVARGQIWWDRAAYRSATAACKGMQGVHDVNGWENLNVVGVGYSLADCYDQHRFPDPPPLSRSQLREFLGDVLPSSVGLTPKADAP